MAIRRLAMVVPAVVLAAASLVTIGGATVVDAAGGPSMPPPSGRTLRVPADFADLDRAIAASRTGDVILLAPGTYPGDVLVPSDRPGITIRGENRNTVVFDGGDERQYAIEVAADGVTLENMSAHNFAANAFYWEDVEGFAGRYLTVWNVGLYGIYAIESRGGIMEDSYVSGAADAAFYIGECQPCDATIRNVTATLSAVGYSGTNAGGNLVVEDSHFLQNSIGILPNSFDVALEPPPQRDAVFRNNEVAGSGTVPTPRQTPLGGYTGIGIGVAGGQRDLIEGNEVRDSARYGIAIFTALDRANRWVPADNDVRGNRVSGSGIADLALAADDGGGNCFEDNEAATALPPDVGAQCSLPGGGDATVAEALNRSPFDLGAQLPTPPAYTTMPVPPAQPTMDVTVPVDTPSPAPSRAPAPEAVPDRGTLTILIVMVVLAAASVVVLAFRSRISPSRD